MDLSVESSLSAILVLGAIVFEEISPHASREEGDASVRAIEEHVRSKLATDAAREEFRTPARRLYKAFGIDPTKHRPSSEQLMLRVLKGDPFPRVNPLVDAVNVCQLRFGLPYGL